MKTIEQMDLDNKRVILRCDFNVPMTLGKINDDTKIQKSLKTIQYLIDHNCRIVIMSHLGKIKFEDDLPKNSLAPVCTRLSELLNRPVKFSPKTRGVELDTMVAGLQPGEVLLMENTRYEDLPFKLESKNDAGLADYWSSFGDIFVMDAFASSHRKHASTNGIAKLLPTCIGYLVMEEVENLDKYIINPKKPFSVLMGGAKVDDKLDLIEAMLKKCDYLVLTGGLANTCLRTLGFNVGESLVSLNQDIIERLKKILYDYKDKIILPLDVIVGNTYDSSYVDYKLIDQISVDDVIGDVGNKTIEKIKELVAISNTIFVNGTVGKYEDMRFANGTKDLFNVLKESNKIVVIGGGDTSAAINTLGFNGCFNYVSSGGGATLEYLTLGHMKSFEDIKGD
ncbi:MAG: phosphoglycerate kinase [Bacilli bacterium]|nr:phosphoglycerate kinase [Bacilli bacterium]